MADPLRQAILDELGFEDATAAELIQRLDFPADRVRYGVRRLRAAGMVQVSRKTRRGRVTENVYSVDPAGLVIDDAPSELPLSLYKKVQAPLLRLMLREAMEAARAQKEGSRNDSLVRIPLPIDDVVRPEAAILCGAALDRILEIRRRNLERRTATTVDLIRTVATVLYFELPLKGVWETETEAEGDDAETSADARSRHRVMDDALASKIVDSLAIAPAAATELAQQLGVGVERVRWQLELLSRKGRVIVDDRRQRRGTVQNVYASDLSASLHYWNEPARVTPAANQAFWLDAIPTIFRGFLNAVRSESFQSRDDHCVYRVCLTVDRRGLDEVEAVVWDLTKQLIDLQKSSFERQRRKEGRPREGMAAIFFFEVPRPTPV